MTERLHYEIVGAGIQTSTDAGLVVPAADEDDRHQPVLSTQLTADVDSGPVRQNPVQEDGDRLRAEKILQPGLGGVAGDRSKSLFLDDCRQKLRGFFRILDYQKAASGARH